MNGEGRHLRTSSGAAVAAPASHELHRVLIVSAGSDLSRRRVAALRCEPLAGTGRRDPLFSWERWDVRPCSISRLGLSSAELAVEARRLRLAGWKAWEFSVRFSEPPRGRRGAA